MKKLFILFSFIFCVSGWGQNLDAYFDQILPSSNDRFDIRINQARSQALTWTQNYYLKYKKNYYDKYPLENAEITHMINSLTETKISKMKKSATQSQVLNCTPNTLAFTYFETNPNIISFFEASFRICPLSFSDSILQLAQTLVHEAYHAAEAELNHLFRTKQSVIDINNSPEKKEAWAVSYEMRILKSNVGCAYYESIYFSDEKYHDALKDVGAKQLRLCR